MNFLFDIPNLLVCIIAIIIACRIQIIPNWIGFIFIGYSFVPFILNDFLFPARYMKDQFFYLYAMQEVRSFNIIPDIDYSRYLKAFSTSWLLSFLPLPYVETIKSLGFFNRFLFFVTFCWLYNKKFLTGMPLLFVLFYPSLLFYILSELDIIPYQFEFYNSIKERNDYNNRGKKPDKMIKKINKFIKNITKNVI